jgi:5-methyltetrahydropteroyltriglutamate--homocysteine methyltransferase
MLSLGVINGRNVWRADLDAALTLVRTAVRSIGSERVLVAPSCSLLHVPFDVDAETGMDYEVRSWLAFAAQKLDEVSAVAHAASGQSSDANAALFERNRRARASRDASLRVHSPRVKERLDSVTHSMMSRNSAFAVRRAAQQARLGLPSLPTTTIGSFPQTSDVRRTRAAYRRGDIGEPEYHAFLEREIEQVLRSQEDWGLDVLVHGEPERSDMVEYFAERLDGFVFTRDGWVQSYGSRGVRPPIIIGDVARPAPMTVHWSVFAQSRTSRPVKGMLTGPVTILQWSFVRDDQPREATCRQIALAIRDEVADLAAGGLAAIQIDEPALREGLPLRKEDRAQYAAWSVACFRLASSGVADDVQIHTHMCYSEFGDIIDAIAAMDADVISIESSRSKMEMLQQLGAHGYPNDIGPGVYDIHSPRVPTVEEITELLNRALSVLSPAQLWVNPDCGLKTRGWEEVGTSLRNMVEAARVVRSQLSIPAG